MSDIPGMRDHCRHCGAQRPSVLGRCEVCGSTVCASCGNTQHKEGKKVVVHDSCLGDFGNDDGFSMIRFVD